VGSLSLTDDRLFADLVRRVRSGDQDAAAQLVRQFEPAIRRAIKMQLRDHRLRRVLDSMDICQSVMGAFFVRAALGQFDFEKPEDLLKLLATMVRNKLATKARQPQVARRDYRSVEADSNTSHPLLARDHRPSQLVAGCDLLQAVRQRLTLAEVVLAEQRAHGHEWAEIAAASGGSPEALRKKLARALDVRFVIP
jgi:DNA-directed RNA polymerase specialized sigma24 family protein